jgi:hypothetical protein
MIGSVPSHRSAAGHARGSGSGPANDEIFLTEIERSQKTGLKANFIVLLGERYGWRPVPARISDEKFSQVRSP